jgi:beta-lactamase class A
MMIKLSNNECAIDFLYKVGYQGVTNDAQAIGAKSTSFMGNDGIKSTANDEALFLSLLYSGQILSQQSSRDRLITAMKGNVYRQGIPSGIPNARVADKVGFLDALLHDASIVYSPKGTYVLIILTNNASWGNIAELAKEIESVR